MPAGLREEASIPSISSPAVALRLAKEGRGSHSLRCRAPEPTDAYATTAGPTSHQGRRHRLRAALERAREPEAVLELGPVASCSLRTSATTPHKLLKKKGVRRLRGRGGERPHAHRVRRRPLSALRARGPRRPALEAGGPCAIPDRAQWPVDTRPGHDSSIGVAP